MAQDNAKHDLLTLFKEEVDSDVSLRIGLENLAKLPSLNDVEANPMKHKRFEKGMMGFRRKSSYMSIAIACGKAMVRNIDPRKFVIMVEEMVFDDRKETKDRKGTIMLENFSDADDGRAARGQVLGCINPKHSAICIVQGLTGRIIRSDSDVVRYDVYYIGRDQLAAFYLACKYQLRGGDDLENMISTYDGWVEYDIPLGLCDASDKGFQIK